MSRLAFITDLHFRGSNIKSRSDIYHKALFKKLKWVTKYCVRKKIPHLIIGGDLLDHPNVSGKVVGKIAKILYSAELQVYFIMGNHDITGKNPDTYENGQLAGWESYDWFNFIGGTIGKEVIDFGDCCLAGVDYTYEDEYNSTFMMPKYNYGKKKKIFVTHSMISGDKKDFLIGGRPIIMSYKNVNTNANLLLTGHFHPGFGIKKLKILENDVYIANPGSFARTNVLVDKTTVGPGLIDIQILKGKMKLKHVIIPHKKNIFTGKLSDVKYDIDPSKLKFIYSLKDMKNSKLVQADIGVMIKVLQGENIVDLGFEITDDLVEFILMKIKEVKA